MRVLLVVVTLALIGSITRLAAAYTPPPITGHVTDPMGKLTTDERLALDKNLESYRICSKHEIAAFVAPSLGGASIEDVAHGTLNTWKIGRAGEDDGVLLVIAPNERQVRIETGKGVGGELTDVQSFHIIRDQIKPRLKDDKFFAAIDDGTKEIARALGGCAIGGADVANARKPVDRTAPSPAPTKTEEPSSGPLALVLGLFAVGSFFVVVFYGAFRDRTMFLAFPFAFVAAIAVMIIAGSVFDSGAAPCGGYLVTFFGILLPLWRAARKKRGGPWRPNLDAGTWFERSGGSSHDGASSNGASSESSYTSSSSSSSSSSSDGSGDYSGSGYTGGGGSSGGGGASDSY